MMMRRSIILPASLSIVGLLLLTGCIFIPTFGIAVKGTYDVSSKIGPAESKKPLRINISTSTDVEKNLGRPTEVSPGEHHAVYEWQSRVGYIIFPLCLGTEYGAGPIDNAHWVILSYDNRDILIGVTKTDDHYDVVRIWEDDFRALPPQKR